MPGLPVTSNPMTNEGYRMSEDMNEAILTPGEKYLLRFVDDGASTRKIIRTAIYEQDWGCLRKNAFQIIVSCGYGTWGPPIRIGNRPEILNIKVTFAELPQP